MFASRDQQWAAYSKMLMNEPYLISWLSDQLDDYPERFPKDFDFDQAVNELNAKFDDQVIQDHLDELLTHFLSQI